MIYLFPTELEAQEFRAMAPDAQIVICGVGAAACAAATAQVIAQMRREGSEKMLVLAGTAGSYSLSDVAMGAVVEVTSEQIWSLPQRFSECYVTQPQTSLQPASSNSVNCSGEGRMTPYVDIENMEGAAFMAVCQAMGVKTMQIRAISNKVGDPFDEWRFVPACYSLAEALFYITLSRNH